MKMKTGKLFYNISERTVQVESYDLSKDYYTFIKEAQEKNCRQVIITSDIMIQLAEFLLTEGNSTITSISFFVEDADLQDEIDIISTLSFLLESQNLNQITLDIAYREHSNIEVTLSNRNTVATTEERYLGALISEGCSAPELISTILLTLYIEVLPILIQSYQSEIDSNLWGQGKCVDFLKQVANDLSKKVTKRVEDLEQRPEQLKMSFDGNVLLDGVSQP